MKKKKKVKFGTLRPGDYFKYCRRLYILDSLYDAVDVKSGRIAYLRYDVNATPVTVTIKVKEK